MAVVSTDSVPSDNALCLQLQAGSKDALGLLADRYYRPLFQYGTKLTPDHALIQDCIQDLFLTIWEKRQTLPVLQSVKAYLFVALRHNVLHQVKQHSHDEPVEESLVAADWLANPELLYVQHEQEQTTQACLNHALAQLPKRQREAIYLKYYENLSYEEIAAAMGLNRQVVANYLHHALHTLRTHWPEVAQALVLLTFLL